jgi:hypothetical protein
MPNYRSQFFKNTLQTERDGDSTQWKKAFDWGNHATSGYIVSSTTNMAGATGINNIVSISQSGYNNLPVSSGGPGYDANTVYFIT